MTNPNIEFDAGDLELIESALLYYQGRQSNDELMEVRRHKRIARARDVSFRITQALGWPEWLSDSDNCRPVDSDGTGNDLRKWWAYYANSK